MEYSISVTANLSTTAVHELLQQMVHKQALMLWGAIAETPFRMLVTKNSYQSLINKYILTCRILQIDT